MKIAFFTDTYLPEVNGVTTTLTKLSSYLEKRNLDDQGGGTVFLYGCVSSQNYND